MADGGKPLRNGMDNVLPKTPCYYDVFHLTREFSRCIGLFRKDQHCYQQALQEHEDRIERFKLTEEDCSATFNSLKKIKERLAFDIEAIDILRKGIGRTIHKALSLTQPYTYAEREAFYNKTLQSIERIVTDPTGMRRKADNLYSLLYCQKDNLLGLFRHEDSTAKIRASSMVENFNFSLRQQLTEQVSVSQNYLDLQRFYLNHRRFLASHAPARIGRSPAELLDHTAHPHWLEQLGYQRL